MANNIPPSNVPLLNKDGTMSPPWYRFLAAIDKSALQVSQSPTASSATTTNSVQVHIAGVEYYLLASGTP